MIAMTLYRCKVYKTFQAPGRPRVTFPIAYGSLHTDCKRVANHVNFINAGSPAQVVAVLQEIKLCDESLQM